MIPADAGRTPGSVLDGAQDCLRSGTQAALVTLLAVDGSAYRRPGAKRLVVADGADSGSIVPGCLDASVTQTAETVLETGDPRTVTVDLRGDDGAWGPGIGCDGVVDLLVEPVDETLREPLVRYADGKVTGVVTVVESEQDRIAVGDRASSDAGVSPIRGDWPTWLTDRIETVVDGHETTPTGTVTLDGPTGAVTVFVDWFVPSPRLIVFGTGHDAQPIVEASRLAGFEPAVVGFRGGRTNPDRFPRAASVQSARPGSVGEAVAVDADTLAVVATHNFVDDRLTVEQLLPSPAPYIGVVGSGERFERLLDALEYDLSAADRERLYGPAGLDIGAGEPSQVALAIVSEAVAVYNGRNPGHLSERSGPIHERQATE